MANFVIGFRKIKTDEAFKNRIVGHNNRGREYPQTHSNIDSTKSGNNIVLEELKFKSEAEIRQFALDDKAKGKRQLQQNKAFAFEIIVDCSVMEKWQNEDYVKFLKKAEEWLKSRFEGQKVAHSIIHMDEGKPHLHITFLYYNVDIRAWGQKELYKQKTTDLNKILVDFEEDVGVEFGLKKGEKIKDFNTKSLDKNDNFEVEILEEKKLFGKDKTIKKEMVSLNMFKKLLDDYNNLAKYVNKNKTLFKNLKQIEFYKSGYYTQKKELENVEDLEKKVKELEHKNKYLDIELGFYKEQREDIYNVKKQLKDDFENKTFELKNELNSKKNEILSLKNDLKNKDKELKNKDNEIDEIIDKFNRYRENVNKALEPFDKYLEDNKISTLAKFVNTIATALDKNLEEKEVKNDMGIG